MGGGEWVTISKRGGGDSSPENPEGKGRFFFFSKVQPLHMCDLFVSFASFSPLLSPGQRPQTFFSWEALGLALPLVWPWKERYVQKCLGHRTAEEEEGNLCSSPALDLKGRNKEGFTLGFRLLRLWTPFPLHPTLLTDKQAGRSHFSTAASWAASLSLVIKITYLPAGREPDARPCPGAALGTLPSFLSWSSQSPWNSPPAAPGEFWGHADL